MMAEATDQTVSDFACRLRDRKLYKSIDIRTEVSRHVDPTGENTDNLIEKIDRACVQIKEKITEWSSQHSDEVPRVLIDEAERSPYKSVEETRGPLDRINIRTAGGDLMDLKERSSVVGALKLFKLFRVYVKDNDEVAREMINKIVKGEIGS
jgi:HD superfamily phosphohydrolase